MTRGEYGWPLHIYISNSQHSHYLKFHFAHFLGLKQSSCESEDRIFSILIGRKKKQIQKKKKAKQIRILFDISFITSFTVHFALKILTHFKSIVKQLSCFFYTTAAKSLSWTFLTNNSHSLLNIVNAICLQGHTSHLPNLFVVDVPVPWSQPWISWLSSAWYAVPVRDTLCLFVIRYACSRYPVSGRDTPCLGHNTLCLFEECGAFSNYGERFFFVPVATTNWILTLIPNYNASFGWFLLRKIVNCCGYRLSISLSTPTVWHLIYPLSFSKLGNLRWPFCLRGLH